MMDDLLYGPMPTDEDRARKKLALLNYWNDIRNWDKTAAQIGADLRTITSTQSLDNSVDNPASQPANG